MPSTGQHWVLPMSNDQRQQYMDLRPSADVTDRVVDAYRDRHSRSVMSNWQLAAPALGFLLATAIVVGLQGERVSNELQRSFDESGGGVVNLDPSFSSLSAVSRVMNQAPVGGIQRPQWPGRIAMTSLPLVPSMPRAPQPDHPMQTGVDDEES